MKGLLRHACISILIIGLLYGVFCLAYVVDRAMPDTPEPKELTLEEKKAIYEAEQESLQFHLFSNIPE